MRFVTDGLILKEKESGENDKLLLVLSAERGKIWVCAKGGRSIKSQKSAICRPFTFGELEIYEKHDRLWLSGGSPHNSFFAYQPNLTSYALAAYIAEICDEITGEGEDATAILRATLNAFFALEKGLYPESVIKSAYETFAAAVSGFCPELDSCIKCGRTLESTDNGLWLDVMNGGVLCHDCFKTKSTAEIEGDTDIYETRNILLPLDSASRMALKFCSSAPPNKLFKFSITNAQSEAYFAHAAETYLKNHLERGFETLNFYNSIKD